MALPVLARPDPRCLLQTRSVYGAKLATPAGDESEVSCA
eukprot:CAMPEP_0179185438 /NCGR_PEP_ID=MMETSP0796-20121207/91953_1 /TAXON_ID=73915 /ORGANISM="Pyrodinium bahamense, Strain pbaha01" /LENGTH=38 /DNA_ID= /DNA_START= /DNA_END= /DNA_ORIENTATION=